MTPDQSAEAEGVGDAAQVSQPIREAPTLPSRQELERALREAASTLEDARKYIRWQVVEGFTHHPTMPSFIGRLATVRDACLSALTSKEQNNG